MFYYCYAILIFLITLKLLTAIIMIAYKSLKKTNDKEVIAGSRSLRVAGFPSLLQELFVDFSSFVLKKLKFAEKREALLDEYYSTERVMAILCEPKVLEGINMAAPWYRTENPFMLVQQRLSWAVCKEAMGVDAGRSLMVRFAKEKRLIVKAPLPAEVVDEVTNNFKKELANFQPKAGENGGKDSDLLAKIEAQGSQINDLQNMIQQVLSQQAGLAEVMLSSPQLIENQGSTSQR
ncbi:hypothetical protein CYMTET_10638 [Cymbomonas tetramitiformis]|uniref:Uncharacterized protein n=1 Tax=Cymbomonas tetramitiformis TaxID=36881 RepID=A0AAE0LDY9_9CHLO|nr:hypothetical protein CYMTET_10638 [Cymbomonas tetramitiformis]